MRVRFLCLNFHLAFESHFSSLSQVMEIHGKSPAFPIPNQNYCGFHTCISSGLLCWPSPKSIESDALHLIGLLLACMYSGHMGHVHVVIYLIKADACCTVLGLLQDSPSQFHLQWQEAVIFWPDSFSGCHPSLQPLRRSSSISPCVVATLEDIAHMLFLWIERECLAPTVTCSSSPVAFPTSWHIFAGYWERFEGSSATSQLPTPLHFDTPAAHPWAPHLSRHLPCGEHQNDLEGCGDIFPPPTCSSREKTLCDVTWCGVCRFNTWCNWKAQLLKLHSNYVRGAGEGTVLNKGNPAIPKPTSHFTQSIWEEHALPFLSWILLIFQSNSIAINP